MYNPLVCLLNCCHTPLLLLKFFVIHVQQQNLVQGVVQLTLLP